MIRFIPNAIVDPRYKWKANFWAYCQKKIYGNLANKNSLVTIVRQNNTTSPVHNEVDWNLYGLPYYLCKPIWSYVDSRDENCVVINVFSSVKELLHLYNDTDVIVLGDMDIILLKKYDDMLPGENSVICFDGYEDWHMHIADESKKNYNRILKYLSHTEGKYMNGGFVPILIQTKTLKKIIDDVINIAEDIIKTEEDVTWKWWACMTAFSIACHNHKIKMIGLNNTYIPGFNQFDLSNHYFVHYSVDSVFNKSTFPNHNIADYPNNPFYNLVKEWIVN